MEYEFIRQRITALREKKGVAEYKMSLELGHSRNYMQNITSGKSKPSIEEFLYICEYFGITPAEFFDTECSDPILMQQAAEGMKTLSEPDLKALIAIIDRLNHRTK